MNEQQPPADALERMRSFRQAMHEFYEEDRRLREKFDLLEEQKQALRRRINARLGL